MTYAEIKANLATARRLLDAGDIAGADRTIRAMVGKGLTRADLDANLTPNDLRLLREYGKKA